MTNVAEWPNTNKTMNMNSLAVHRLTYGPMTMMNALRLPPVHSLSPTTMTASEMLAKHPKCAYTTARCFDDAVFELKRHLRRLKTSHESLGSATSATIKVDDFEAGVVETMRASLRGALSLIAARPAAANLKTGTTTNSKMTVLVTHDDEIYALTEMMKERKPNELIRCVIRGDARVNPSVKDTQWVLDRKAIVDETAEETLLTNPFDSDEILEGTQSNFFVVDSRDRVVTAPNGTVLAGTIRDVVLEACEDLKIEVVMRPPRWSERESEFKEAFLTSTSRLVMKVDVIERGATRFSFPFLNSQLTFSEATSVVRRVSNWVAKEIPKRCSRL